MTGVTLTTAVLTGMATYRAGMEEVHTRHHPVDASITSLDAPITADLLAEVRRTPVVEQAATVDGAVATISGFDAPLPVLTAGDAVRVARGGERFGRVEPGTIHLDLGAFVAPDVGPGDVVTVAVGDRQARLRSVWLPSGPRAVLHDSWRDAVCIGDGLGRVCLSGGLATVHSCQLTQPLSCGAASCKWQRHHFACGSPCPLGIKCIVGVDAVTTCHSSVQAFMSLCVLACRG